MTDDPARKRTYAALCAGVLVVTAYLCLVNLDYAAVWHDESVVLIARNLLERGDIVGWDGRNLVGGTNGRTLNADLRDTWPPLMYVVNAAGLALFGVNETGARIMPALIGIVALGLLYLLLRQHLADHPRLICFILLFAAWSPQLLLYFRQSRYYAGIACFLIAAFYLYERWWQTRRPGLLVALTAVAALAFFNLYTAGAATMLALAAWHLLFRARRTTLRQWLALAACALVVAGLGAAYLAWLGVIGGDRTGHLAYAGFTHVPDYAGATPLILLRLAVLRDLFTADWISWPVLLWFAGMALWALLRRRGWPGSAPPPAASRRRGGRRRGKREAPPRGRREAPAEGAAPGAPEARGATLPLAAAGKVVLMGALFAVGAAAVSVQPVWTNPFLDLRYYVGALPLLLAMKGLFVEWLWRWNRLAGAAAAAILLVSSAGAWPINLRNHHTGEPTLGLHLLQFVREIHRPYRDATRVVADYLREHAAQDDLVWVPTFPDREALTFAIGDKVLFCCVFDEHSPLPPATVQALGPRMTAAGTIPDWIIIFEELTPAIRDGLARHLAHPDSEASYVIAAQLDVYPFPTQRPELNHHVFEPLSVRQGVQILRRQDAP